MEVEEGSSSKMIIIIEPSPYDKLPSELREEILARVPCATQLFRLRLVCKAWNSLISSQTFARLQCQTGSPEPWLIVVRTGRSPNQKLCLCDRSMQRRILPPFPFLKEFQSDFSTCKSHGGLVCCIASRAKRGPKTVLVFNPLTGDYKLLPTPPYPGLWSRPTLDLALWRSKNNGHFKVAVCDTTTRDVRVFDSRKGYWKEGSRPPDVGNFKPRFEGYRNTSKEKLYWYDIEGNAWLEATLPSVEPLGLKCPSVFKGNDGRIMLAAVLAMVDGGRHASVQGFGVWSLRKQQHAGHSDQQQEKEARPDLMSKRHNHHEQNLQIGDRKHVGKAKINQEDEGKFAQCQALQRDTVCNSPSPSTKAHQLFSLPSSRYFNRDHHHSQEPTLTLHRPPPHPPKENVPTWIEISRTPPHFLRGPRGVLHRLNDSTLICHHNYVCMTGLLRFSLSPWNCFYPWLLVFNPPHDVWKWSPHPLGDKTWANFHVVCVLEPNLQSIY